MPSECNYEAKRSETERAGDVLETVREARRLDRAPVSGSGSGVRSTGDIRGTRVASGGWCGEKVRVEKKAGEA